MSKLTDDAHYAALIAESNRRAERSAAQFDNEEAARWHIVHVASGSETTTTQHLKRFNFQVYYPITRVLRRVARRSLSAKQRRSNEAIRKPRDEPLFKGYMFVRMNLHSGLWREVFGMRGVRGMVYNNDVPAEVPDEMIARMQAREVAGLIPGDTTIENVLGFTLGDQVIVNEGPFASFPGVVERLGGGYKPGMKIEKLDESMRCRILVSIFGRETPIDLEIGQFTKV